MTGTITSDTVTESSPVSKKRSAAKFMRDILVIFLIAILASVLIKTFIARSFYIPSGSMEHTLEINDRILVNQLEPRFMGLEHGDVVVFKDPGGWLPPAAENKPEGLPGLLDEGLKVVGLVADDTNDHLIKRVIGLPGDHVVCCNALGQIEVNDIPLDEPYIVHSLTDPNSAAVTFDVTVPDNSVWVMGDNRFNSKDSSRNQDQPGHGFVPIDNIVGRAALITWPIDRWTLLDNYPNVFAGIK